MSRRPEGGIRSPEPEVRRVSSGSRWEPEFGYSRAVRAGAYIWVSGTTGVGADGKAIAPRDAYRQSVRALEIISEAIRSLGGSDVDVIRTRVFVTDVTQWREVGRAHRERFGASPPASTLVEVPRLIDPELVVEIEAEAFVPSRAVETGPGIRSPGAQPRRHSSRPRRRSAGAR